MKLGKITTACAVAAATLTSIAAVPTATAQDRCPAVVVLAARGSGQNGGYEWTPTQYGDSRWISNGREGSTIRTFLNYAENVHQRDHGTSLYSNVQVVGVDERAYPANFPEQDFRQPTNIAEAMTELTDRAIPRAKAFLNSISVGRIGAEATVRAHDAATGCNSKYLLVGFSQGATVITDLEKKLAREGRLAGALYMGSPYTSASDPHRVGSGLSGNGVLANAIGNGSRIRSNDKRIEYCVKGDVWCDFNAAKVAKGEVENPWGHNQYFIGNTPFPGDRDMVARMFADLIHNAG